MHGKDSYSTLNYTQRHTNTSRYYRHAEGKPKASATAVTSRKLKVQLPKVSATVGLNILANSFFTPKVKYSGLFSWVMSEISYIFVGFMPI